MIDRGKLGDRVGARGGVGRAGSEEPPSRTLADRQRLPAIAHRRRETGRQDIARRRQQRRAGTVGAIAVRQRPARVGGVGGDVASAAGVAARQRIVVELHQQVRRHRRRVVVDVDRQRTGRRIAVAVGGHVVDRELEVVLRPRQRMIDRGKLGDRVGARGGVGRAGSEEPPCTLADRQRQPVIAHRRRETGRQDSPPRQQRRAGTVGAIAVRQRSARVGGVGGTSPTPPALPPERIVVELHRRVRRHQRTVILEAQVLTDAEDRRGAVAVPVRDRPRQRYQIGRRQRHRIVRIGRIGMLHRTYLVERHNTRRQ